jgi:hypothetical protein
MESTIDRTLALIGEAREIVESFDPTGAATIGFDGPCTLSPEQMTKIAGALYMADCEIENIKNADGRG